MPPRTKTLSLLAVALMVCVSAPSNSIAQDRDKENAELETAYWNAKDAHDYAKAIEIGLQLVERAPRGGTAAYNLACAYQLSGDRQNALEYLRRAVKDGFKDVEGMLRDPDLLALREDTSFKAILQDVRNNRDRAMEEFKKKVAASTPIIVAPPGGNAARPRPLVIALHAFGGTAEDIVGSFRKPCADMGAVLVVPRAVVEAPATGFNWENADNAERIVESAIEIAAKDNKIDEKKICIAGFSQGGWIAYQLGLRRTTRKYCGVIPIAGLCKDLSIPATPLLPRFFIMVGDRDPLLAQNRDTAATLERKGVAVQMKVYPGLGHAFPPDSEADLRTALAFTLGISSQPSSAPAGDKK